jgi:AMP-binding enzyme
MTIPAAVMASVVRRASCEAVVEGDRRATYRELGDGVLAMGQVSRLCTSVGFLGTDTVAMLDADDTPLPDLRGIVLLDGSASAGPSAADAVPATEWGTFEARARMGEVGMADVVAAPGRAVVPEEIIEWTRDRLANYKVPRHVRVVPALPINAAGKVVKEELRAIEANELARQ